MIVKTYLITAFIAFHFFLLAAADCQAQSDVEFRATVRVYASDDGAGIIVGRAGAEVLVLTAYHVVKDSKEIRVSFYDRRDDKFPARKINDDKKLDIALLSVSGAEGASLPVNLPVLGVSDVIKVGSPVHAIGHLADTGWITRQESVTLLTHPSDSQKFLYSSPDVSRGISGGPVFNEKGLLLGIVLNRWPSGDAVALRILAVLKVLRDEWKVTPNLIAPPGSPVKSSVLHMKPVAITVELTRISVLQKGGRGVVKWSYQVFLNEEQLLFEGDNKYTDRQRDGSEPDPVGVKKEVTFSRGVSHPLKIVAVKTAGGVKAEGQIHLNLQDATGKEVPVRVAATVENKGSFIFYFTIKRSDPASFPPDKVEVMGDRSFLIDVDRQIADLNGLITQAGKIEGETDLDRFRILFAGWRKRCSIILGQVDEHRAQLTGQPTNFQGEFASVVGRVSEDINNLPRAELINRLLSGAEHMGTVITMIK